MLAFAEIGVNGIIACETYTIFGVETMVPHLLYTVGCVLRAKSEIWIVAIWNHFVFCDQFWEFVGRK